MRAKNVPATGSKDRDCADDQRVVDDLRRREVDGAEEHDGDERDRVGLEEVGGHAGTVADVVADVVGDHGRVSRVVLGDSRLDLADEVGADIGGLGVDAAAEAGEDRDQRAAEGKTDEVLGCGVLALVEPLDENPVVAGHAEQPEADNQQARDRPGGECDPQRRRDALLGCLRGTDVRADRDVHPDEAGCRREDGADQEADRRIPAEVVPEPDDEEEDDGDEGDRRVLAAEVGGCALLHGLRDLLHPLCSGRKPEEPERLENAVDDRDARTDERDQDGMVSDEVGHGERRADSPPRREFLPHARGFSADRG